MNRGGGCPALKPCSNAGCADWACRPGASPTMRMTASWCVHTWIDRIQGCGVTFWPRCSSLGSVVPIFRLQDYFMSVKGEVPQ